MRIGIVSDTHRGPGDGPLPVTLLERLRGVDLILHAGDLTVMEVLDDLETVAPVLAVAGNMDTPEVREKLPVRRIVSAEKVRIGLIHGWGPPWDLPDKVLREFGEDVQVVVFGHSHRPHREWRGERLLFNPGSPLRNRFTKECSYGILTVEGDRIEAEIVPLGCDVDER